MGLEARPLHAVAGRVEPMGLGDMPDAAAAPCRFGPRRGTRPGERRGASRRRRQRRTKFASKPSEQSAEKNTSQAAPNASANHRGGRVEAVRPGSASGPSSPLDHACAHRPDPRAAPFRKGPTARRTTQTAGAGRPSEQDATPAGRDPHARDRARPAGRLRAGPRAAAAQPKARQPRGRKRGCRRCARERAERGSGSP